MKPTYVPQTVNIDGWKATCPIRWTRIGISFNSATAPSPWKSPASELAEQPTLRVRSASGYQFVPPLAGTAPKLPEVTPTPDVTYDTRAVTVTFSRRNLRLSKILSMIRPLLGRFMTSSLADGLAE